MQTIFFQEERMERYAFGPESTESFLFNSTVRIIKKLNHKTNFLDQKKDIVSLFPDINKPFLIHSCSMDRSISTYDLKLEKRNGGYQTKNGALFGMSQRKDNEFELVTCG